MKNGSEENITSNKQCTVNRKGIVTTAKQCNNFGGQPPLHPCLINMLSPVHTSNLALTPLRVSSISTMSSNINYGTYLDYTTSIHPLPEHIKTGYVLIPDASPSVLRSAPSLLPLFSVGLNNSHLFLFDMYQFPLDVNLLMLIVE